MSKADAITCIYRLQAIYFEAFIDFLTVYSKTELCSDAKIDFVAVYTYVQTKNFKVKHFEYFRYIQSYEKVYELCSKEIEYEVLHNFPLWHFLKMSKWLSAKLDEEFLLGAKR